MGILDDLEEQSRNSNFGSTVSNIPFQNDEFYISELCELEKEFGDEFFIDVGIDELDAFNRKRKQKIENVRLLGKILTEMDETDVEFSDPQAEGAANLVRGISTYIDDHADIPVYLRTSTRTVAEEAVFQSYTHQNFPEVDIRNFVFDGQPIEVKSRICPHSEKKKQQEKVAEQKREDAEARKAEEKKAEEEAAKAAAEEKKKKRPAMDQAYLNNLKAMKVNIPAKVTVPEPFLGSATTRTSSSSRFGSSSIRSMSSRFSTSSVGSSVGSAYKPSSGTKYTTASKYSSYSKY
ncbi:unnamed protein product [Oikopleura dioica]|uniref:Uncharacterized protein n=1 Tax=Oikopleura dioica TaxID=34765 RepID=E4XI29_OIKDI|nr:unnamed protein product [Oikopleura dioica]CBY36296.1 unnamed protein product [Oikopleura dioica]